MIICPNCGAEIENDVTKCPYCGFINMEGAQKQFNAQIAEIEEDIENEKKKPAKAFRKGLAGGFKVILITVGILAVLAAIGAVILIYELRDEPRMNLSPDEEAYAAAYRVEAGAQLEEAYEDRDIAKLAEIFDKAHSEDRISLWGDPHYETGYAASCYEKFLEVLAALDKGGLSDKEAEAITYYCFYFYYEAYGEDGAAIFDSIREEEILPVLYDRLGYTEDDMEEFRELVLADGVNVNRTEVHSVTKKLYKNYH